MLNRWQSTIVDAQGNIQPFAILTILNEETQAPAQIYASESESQPLPVGTVVADESGYAYFYARGGRYRIQADDLSIDWRHVPLGNLQGMDVEAITPIGMIYTQYPGTEAPSSLFGGTWTLMFNTEGVFFRTEGTNANAFGSNIQGGLVGSHRHRGLSSNGHNVIIGSTTGSSTDYLYDIVARNTNSTGSPETGGTGSGIGDETRPRNRTVRVWRKTTH